MQRLHVAILDNGPDLMLSAGRPRGEGASTIGFVAAVPRTLPPMTADFTGREAEISLLATVLTSEDTLGGRVVAISGSAGAGKTALAIQVAHLLRDKFPDGQLYANMRGADFDQPEAPLDVLGRFLRSLGVDGQALPASLDERAELFRDLVAGRRLLVVLDNAAGDNQILPLLPGGPGCGVIVTGRSRLGATLGARTLDLPSLGPEQAQDLLACIAGATRIAAEPEGAAKLVELCGYLPLAIRVMGAKLVAKPHWSLGKLAALCANENSRLDQLAFQRLDVRSSIGLSYADLNDDARRLLRLVCDIDLPDVTLWASAALLEADARMAESVLENLFDAHLVDVTGRDAAGYPRYRLHDLVRLFARERAVAEDSPDQLRRSRERVYRYCLTLAERQQVVLNGDGGRYIKGANQRWSPDESLDAELLAQPMQWFDQERQTIVEMVQRAASDGCGSLCWELASASGPLLQMRYDFDGLQIILQTALRAADDAGDERGRAAMLCGIGLQHVDRRENEQATKLLTQASSIFDRHGDHRSYGNLVLLLATISRFAGDSAKAASEFEQALELLQSANDEVGVAWVLRSIGQCYLDSQEYERARGYLESSLQKYRSGGASRGEAMALFWIGMLQLNEGQAAIALATFQQATAIARQVTDRPGEAQCLRGIGLAYQAMGERDRAEGTLVTALDMVRQPRPTILEGFIQKSLEDLSMARPAR